MFDSTEELVAKIRLGEDTFLELKEVLFAGDRVTGPHRDSLADELAAFANGRGGVCILGVEDGTREIVGVPLDRLDAVEAFVCEVCSDSIRPPLVPSIERRLLPTTMGTDVAVLKIDVPRSLFVHESPTGHYHRVGSHKRKMTNEYLTRLFQQRSQARLIRFDEQVVSRATLDDLVEPLWERFRRYSADSREVLLQKLGMAWPDEDGIWRPSVAGVLLACADPRRFIPNAFIQAVAYAGQNAVPTDAQVAYQLDAADIGGPVDAQVADACRFVVRNMRTAATKDGGRIDSPQYDLGAVFEALVNAVAHRDYAIHGSKIRLRMFEDRLEITSPGALANTMTVESLPLRQSARNEVITSLLARCSVPEIAGLKTERATLMDKRGEGVAIILERSERLSGRRAKFQTVDDTELVLTIWAAQAPA